MNKKDVVLVTAVGNIGTGSQIMECLFHEKGQDTFLIGTDISSNSINCREKLDNFYKVPRASDQEYEQVLERIITEHSVKLMFVGSMQEAIWCYRHVEFFEKHNVKVVLGEESLFELCMNKANLFGYLKENNIVVPKFKKITKLEECEDVDYFPVVLKQNRYAVASNHTYVAFDKEELVLLCQYALKNKIEMIAQEWKGNSKEEYSISVIHDFSGHSYGSIAIKRDFSSSISRKTTYVKEGREYIISSGITQGVVSDNKKLLEQVERIASVLESKGPLNLQGIWEDEKFWLIDAHPAITSGSYMRALAGFNEPLFWKELLLHQKKIPLTANKVRFSRNIQVKVDKA